MFCWDAHFVELQRQRRPHDPAASSGRPGSADGELRRAGSHSPAARAWASARARTVVWLTSSSAWARASSIMCWGTVLGIGQNGAPARRPGGWYPARRHRHAPLSAGIVVGLGHHALSLGVAHGFVGRVGCIGQNPLLVDDNLVGLFQRGIVVGYDAFERVRYVALVNDNGIGTAFLAFCMLSVSSSIRAKTSFLGISFPPSGISSAWLRLL